jgi:hypothetical protein
MKTSIKSVLLLLLLVSFNACSQPVKNAKELTVHIYGNCGMCETTIEDAAYLKKVAKADWDKDTKKAVITFDSTQTTADEVLKRIAYAGYDNEQYLAPDAAYSKLPECCQYERPKKEAAVAATQTEQPADVADEAKKDTIKPKPTDPLADVFANYFAIKDALVKDDGATASAKAKDLFKAIDAVKMEVLSHEVHMVWMKYMDKLSYDAEHIKDTKESEHQREHFATLSNNMYELIKVANPEYDVYYNHCPMYNDNKGADWLSKESGIKNPYYGAMMLTCGKTIETIK